MDGQTGRAGVGIDGLLHEFGDGAVVDAAIYGAFAAAGRDCYNVFAWIFAWR